MTSTGNSTPQKTQDSSIVYISITLKNFYLSAVLRVVVAVLISMGGGNGKHGEAGRASVNRPKETRPFVVPPPHASPLLVL